MKLDMKLDMKVNLMYSHHNIILSFLLLVECWLKGNKIITLNSNQTLGLGHESKLNVHHNISLLECWLCIRQKKHYPILLSTVIVMVNKALSNSTVHCRRHGEKSIIQFYCHRVSPFQQYIILFDWFGCAQTLLIINNGKSSRSCCTHIPK